MTTNTKKTQEALRMALEALEVATTPLAKDRQEVLRAITAIREALADHIFDANEMVEQSTCKQALQVEQPAQPSKPWVGLSTSDLDEIDAPIRERGHATIAEIYRAIEAKLREKNA